MEISPLTAIDHPFQVISHEHLVPRPDNAYDVYTLDHGMAIGRHGLQKKQDPYEHAWGVNDREEGPGIEPGMRFARRDDWKLIKMEALLLEEMRRPEDPSRLWAQERARAGATNSGSRVFPYGHEWPTTGQCALQM